MKGKASSELWVRSAVRALIIDSGKLLAIRMKRPGGETFHILPGGGQLHGETLVDALHRECLEEIGVRPEVNEIAYVREYIGRHHVFRKFHRDFHQLEIVFHCNLPKGTSVLRGTEEDKHQIGTTWLPLNALKEHQFYPAVINEFIHNGQLDMKRCYLGDIN